MPPKPFKPPRPSASSSNGTPKPGPGRPRKSDSSATSTTKPKSKTGAGISKSKASGTSKNKGKAKEKEREPTRRLSAREMGLESLSPDSDRGSERALRNEDAEEEEEDDGFEEIEDDDDDPFVSQPTRRTSTSTSTNRRQSGPPPQDIDNDDPEREQIPTDLLKVLLSQFFADKGTKIGVPAQKAVGRYMETFVREGIARCVWARSEEGGDEGGGGFLEVEDLEKGAPQLLMDF